MNLTFVHSLLDCYLLDFTFEGTKVFINTFVRRYYTFVPSKVLINNSPSPGGRHSRVARRCAHVRSSSGRGVA